MGAQIKQSSSVQLTNKSGNNGAVQNQGDSGDNYTGITGLLIALISKALREAQDNDMERQKMHAEAEQKIDTALGGLDGKIGQGVLALAAKAVVNQGNATADGEKDMAYSQFTNAGIGSVMALGTAVGGYSINKQSNAAETELQDLNNMRTKLDDPSTAAQIKITDGRMEEDPELVGAGDQELQEMSPGQFGKLKAEPKELEAKRDQADRLIKQKENEVQKLRSQMDKLFTTNQIVTNISQSGTQATGQILKAEHDIDAANASAAADVTKQLGQIDTSSSNSFRESAQSNAQAALRTSDILAQVAQSQVTARG